MGQIGMLGSTPGFGGCGYGTIQFAFISDHR